MEDSVAQMCNVVAEIEGKTLARLNDGDDGNSGNQ
jgi:hypothetical protein